LALSRLGLEVAAVADARTQGHDPWLIDALEAENVPFLAGWTARTARGRKRLTGVELCQLGGASTRVLECDLLGANAGLQSLIGP
ncbi:MAG: hypothetical protein GWO24_38315, partial [Akkermansiaceae bacterium]|nr:hypothetical protein [Akkermansiaceae bacterium]